jgi:hypothetical protein
VDALSPGAGFSFLAEKGEERLTMGSGAKAGAWRLRADAPAPANLRILRNGAVFAEAAGARRLEAPAGEPGVYRVEARLPGPGGERPWIISNPIYLRDGGEA